jgi:branched-chain amino acid transport system ATP-binding protein
LSAIIVEQHAQKLLKLTDDAVILERGDVVWSGPSAGLATDNATLATYLGVAKRLAKV